MNHQGRQHTVARMHETSPLVISHPLCDVFRCRPSVTVSLINAYEGCFSQNMFSCLARDVTTGRVLARRQMIDRERKQTELVVVRGVVMWWA